MNALTELNAELNHGDCRTCPRHPGEKISSPDGLFDWHCGSCEADAEAEYEARQPQEPFVNDDTIFSPEVLDDCPF